MKILKGLMTEIYWITRLANLHVFLLVVVVLCIVGIIFFSIFYTEIEEKYCLKWLRRCIAGALVSGFLMVFIPTKRDLILIYGIGPIYDFIKESPTAKQIPENILKALEEWVTEEDK